MASYREEMHQYVKPFGTLFWIYLLVLTLTAGAILVGNKVDWFSYLMLFCALIISVFLAEFMKKRAYDIIDNYEQTKDLVDRIGDANGK